MGYMKTVKGRRPSPRHPWAKYLTETLSYGVPFEKFSWCIRLEDFRINGIQTTPCLRRAASATCNRVVLCGDILWDNVVKLVEFGFIR